MVLMLGKLATKFRIKILITKKEGDCPGVDVDFVSTLENCQKNIIQSTRAAISVDWLLEYD